MVVGGEQAAHRFGKDGMLIVLVRLLEKSNPANSPDFLLDTIPHPGQHGANAAVSSLIDEVKGLQPLELRGFVRTL